MARCPDCNKFVSYEEEAPEVELEVDAEGMVTGTVRIVNACGECGTELREATFEVDGPEYGLTAEQLAKHAGQGHSLEVEEQSSERTDRQEGKGRYAKKFYGYDLAFRVTCSCVEGLKVEGSCNDDIQASSMDELG